MDETATRLAVLEEESRAKYTAEAIAALGEKGQALKNANGEWSYPIGDEADLDNAIHAVGRGGTDHDSIRAYIIKVAAKLDASSKIPDNWNGDGSLKSEDSAPPAGESRIPAVPKRAFFSTTERPVPVEMRMDPGDDPNIANFVGYPSTTGQRYAVKDWLGEYGETISPGAFAKTLREQKDVPLLFNHDGIPLASTASGTSRLSEDGNGLRDEATLDRTDGLTNSICVQLKRQVLNKMSFSFRAVRETWNDAYDERGVDELALYDTSIVTYPANPTTTGELRAEFTGAMGREGLAVMFSARAALSEYAETRTLAEVAEPIMEQAVRVLAVADETMCRRSAGPYVRARTFLVAGLMEDIRAGKKLSAKNEALLQSAVDALNGAAKNHAKTMANHQKAADAIGSVLADATNANDDAPNANGTGANQGAPAGSNPISPADGAGPRAIPQTIAEARKQLAALRSR